MKELEDKEKKESKKMADEDALRKIRAVEEQIEYLQKKLAMAKQVRGFRQILSWLEHLGRNCLRLQPGRLPERRNFSLCMCQRCEFCPSSSKGKKPN